VICAGSEQLSVTTIDESAGGPGITSLHSYVALLGIPLTKTGGVKSPIVIVWVAVLEFPDKSVPVHVRINW
jgi:hypothetical protein